MNTILLDIQDPTWMTDFYALNEADFLSNLDLLQKNLINPMYQLLLNDYPGFLQLLYRIDIKEEKFKKCLEASINLKIVAECITIQITDRIKEKKSIRDGLK